MNWLAQMLGMAGYNNNALAPSPYRQPTGAMPQDFRSMAALGSPFGLFGPNFGLMAEMMQRRNTGGIGQPMSFGDAAGQMMPFGGMVASMRPPHATSYGDADGSRGALYGGRGGSVGNGADDSMFNPAGMMGGGPFRARR